MPMLMRAAMLDAATALSMRATLLMLLFAALYHAASFAIAFAAFTLFRAFTIYDAMLPLTPLTLRYAFFDAAIRRRHADTRHAAADLCFRRRRQMPCHATAL